MAKNQEGVRITFDEAALSGGAPAYNGKYSREDVLFNDNMLNRFADYLTAKSRNIGDLYDLGKYGWQSVNKDDPEDVKKAKRLNNREIANRIYTGAYSSEPGDWYKNIIKGSTGAFVDEKSGGLRWLEGE